MSTWAHFTLSLPIYLILNRSGCNHRVVKCVGFFLQLQRSSQWGVWERSAAGVGGGGGREGNGLFCFKLFLLTAWYLLTAGEMYCKHQPPCLHLGCKKAAQEPTLEREGGGKKKRTDDMPPTNTPNCRCCLDLPAELESLQMFTERSHDNSETGSQITEMAQ